MHLNEDIISVDGLLSRLENGANNADNIVEDIVHSTSDFVNGHADRYHEFDGVATTIKLDADLVTSNKINGSVDGTSITEVDFTTDHETTIGLVADAYNTLDGVISYIDESDPKKRKIIVNAFGVVVCTVTEGASQATSEIKYKVPQAPGEVVRLAYEVAKAQFNIDTTIEDDDGTRRPFNIEMLNDPDSKMGYQSQLRRLMISPRWYRQKISLDSDDKMLIGFEVVSGYHQVLPDTARVKSLTTNSWYRGEDFYISRGTDYESGEYPDAWYLRACDSNLEGYLIYQRSLRNDGYDYARSK